MKMLSRWRLLAFPLLLGALYSLAVERVHAAARSTEQFAGTVTNTLEALEVSGPSQDEYVALPARDLVVKERSGGKRLVLGILLLAAAIIYFSQVTYPKLMPVHHRVLQWAAENALPALDEQGLSKAEYVFRRYQQYAEKEPALVAAEIGTLMIAFTLILSGTIALAFPRRRRIKVLALPSRVP